MYILGISGWPNIGPQDSSAALIKNNEVLAAVEEERLIRIKHAPSALPEKAIKYCLEEAGITMRDVDYISIPISYNKAVERISKFLKFRFGYSPNIIKIDHHRSHASSAYRPSGFNKTMIITSDFSGDGISTTLGYGKDGEIKVLKKFKKPNSLGIFYSVITQYLGFRRDNDEYKVMGLSSYGKATYDLSWFLSITPEGYKLNEEFIVLKEVEPNPSKQEPLYNERFVDKMKSMGINPVLSLSEENFKECHANLAKSAQVLLENVFLHLIKILKKEIDKQPDLTKEEKEEIKSKLVLSGGTALNCVVNQKIWYSGEVEDIYIPSMPHDGGTSLGAAMEVAWKEGIWKNKKFNTSYLGPAYKEEDIENALEITKTKFEKVSNPEKVGSEFISEEKIVGWFQGRSEYGPRALGNRSILSSPQRKEIKDIINRYVKFRENFRPFAPSIIIEESEKYLIKPKYSPYMKITFNIRKDNKQDIAGVVHIDDTTRAQVFGKEDNSRYYDLIKYVKKETGVGVVLNTSFNIKGQPIVNNPLEAVSTFFGTGMDIMLIGSYLIRK